MQRECGEKVQQLVVGGSFQALFDAYATNRAVQLFLDDYLSRLDAIARNLEAIQTENQALFDEASRQLPTLERQALILALDRALMLTHNVNDINQLSQEIQNLRNQAILVCS
jgi:hypothetical protein